MGNGESNEIHIIGFNMREDLEYRLIFNYEIAPVVTVE